MKNKINMVLPNALHLVPPTVAQAKALRSVYDGQATDDQQKRAMEYILDAVCAVKCVPYSASATDASFLSGRQFVGKTLAKIITTPLANWKDD